MNIRQAFLASADHIEAHPARFNFTNETRTPRSIASRACYLGWVAFFMGEPADQDCGSSGENSPLCTKLLGITFAEFQGRLSPIVSALGASYNDARHAPAVLRTYADKYHTAESRALIPASVRAIFEMTPAELAREFA